MKARSSCTQRLLKVRGLTELRHRAVHAGLKKFLKKHAVGEELAVLDKKLGGIVQEKMGINCVYRCVMRGQRTRVGSPSVAWVIRAVAPQAFALTLSLCSFPRCAATPSWS